MSIAATILNDHPSSVGAACLRRWPPRPSGSIPEGPITVPLLRSLADRGAPVAINMALRGSLRSLRPRVRGRSAGVRTGSGSGHREALSWG
jgi:hypothetical protein